MKTTINWGGGVLSSAEACVICSFEIQEAKATNGQKNGSAEESSGEKLITFLVCCKC